MIYAKALSSQTVHGELAAVTLMSTDIDRSVEGLVYSNELWACVVEIALGIWLLWRQLGLIAVAPIIIVLACFAGQSWISKYLGGRQGQWLQAIGERIGTASTVLRSMKSVKLAGLVDVMASLMQVDRTREINLAKHFRWLQVAVTCVCKFDRWISPKKANYSSQQMYRTFFRLSSFSQVSQFKQSYINHRR